MLRDRTGVANLEGWYKEHAATQHILKIALVERVLLLLHTRPAP